MIAILFKRFCFSRLHYYLLLWSIHTIYYAPLKLFEIYDSTTVDSSDDEDEMDYLIESSGGKVNWQFFGETTNCIKISLDYVMGLNLKPWHMINSEYFCHLTI